LQPGGDANCFFNGFGKGAFDLNLTVHFLPFVQWSDNVFHNNFFAAWFTGVTVAFLFAAQVDQVTDTASRPERGP
jgi:hypothetical protein